MKKIFKKIQAFLGIESDRTKNISKHVLLSAIYKGGSIVANFMLVPLTLKFLSTEDYGVWMILSSFVAWFSFFDIGLGNGLRNKYAEAKAVGDMKSARGYVSTAYFTITAICSLLFIASLVVSYFADWAKIFNTSEDLNSQLNYLMPVVFACFSILLTVKLITSIYTADQNHSIQGKITFITALSSLLAVWLLTKLALSSLLLFGIVFSVIPVLILVGLNLYAFSNKYKKYVPNIKFFKKEYFNSIFGLGINFFIIQIAVIVMFSTDSFIITQLFSPEAVVPYTLSHKYVSISSMVFVILLTPFWSSITEAYTKKEYEWIKKSMRNLTKFSLLIIVFIVFLVLISPWSYQFWFGNKVEIPMILTICMGVFFVVTLSYAPFNFFLNGVGKIKLHMYSFAIGAILNIPLSVFLVKYFNLGVEGVILATIICVAPNLVLFPIQYSKLINKRAKGIWNK
ncbi:polysaccharide biosynthesis protein [Maribacter algarum]|uniref:Polysaccharide biosynthesis protein n=1 Tax=Maribacter algarum (ex Zhang et al. 2020) TaxID=2578118 RepID=A0A5S3PY37_9FLAO|nr:MATE family efflux transporter [Maribacter algarum]TMM58207.1 polysaccharide biosynthesis protein [Maribacter algarum]